MSIASKENDTVVAFYIYKERNLRIKKLKMVVKQVIIWLKSDLKNFNIKLQIIKEDSYQKVFKNLVKK